MFLDMVVETVVSVEGVGALNLSNTRIDHYFECGTTTGNVANLVWEKLDGSMRFSTIIRNNKLRLDLTPNVQFSVSAIDLGVYSCRDSLTRESVSINIVEGICLSKLFTDVAN